MGKGFLLMNRDISSGRFFRVDLAGRRVGKVVILPQFIIAGNGGCKWKYKCDCGMEAFAWAESLQRNPNFCCKECRKQVLRKSRTVHGGRYTREYKVWQSMIQRCENPNSIAYKDYGGRGISVCAVWRLNFQAFLSDVGKCPLANLTIERINNDGNYEAGNCRWATVTEQLNNQRRNRIISFNGKTQTWAQWARETGIDKTLIRQRALKGWPAWKILSKLRFSKVLTPDE